MPGIVRNRDNAIYKESFRAGESAPVDFDPFQDAPHLLATAPSTEPQREIWAAAALGREAARAYNESICLQLEGRCDTGSLQRALQDLVTRHEVLRVSFSPDGQTLCLAERIPLDLDVIDISGDLDQLQELREREVTVPFDLLHGPLFRCRIVRVRAARHVVLFTAHHTVCDGWSFGVLLRELAALYNSHRIGIPSKQDPAPGFLEHAARQAVETESRRKEQLAYWREQLDGANTRLELPHDFPRPSRRAFAAGHHKHRIPREVLQQLKARAARRSCTPFTAIGAAVSAWLHRISGQDDLVLGVPAAGQASEGLHGLVGHCVSLLPIRSRLERHTTFDAHLDAFGNTMADGWEHRDCSMGRLVQELSLPRDSAVVPLVQVLLNIDRRIGPLAFDALQATFDGTPRRFENFEMFLNAIDDGDGLLIECTYDATLFSAASIRARLEELDAFIARLTRSEEAISQLDLLTEGERAQLHAFTAGPERHEYPATVDALVREQCARVPRAVATSCGNEARSYAQLAQDTAAVRNGLQARGVGRGDVVGVLLKRDASLPAVLLGILECGAAYLPLDPEAPAERLRWMLDDANVQLIISSEREAASLNAFGGRVVDLESLSSLSLPVSAQGQGEAAPAPDDPAARKISTTRSPDQLPAHASRDAAYIIYTSGSTGKPKGVVVTHGGVANFLRAMRETLEVSDQDRFLALTTLTFDIAVLELLLPLTLGARTEIVPRDVARDGDALQQRLALFRPTVMQATPATWQLLASAGWQGDTGLMVLSGGEALPAPLAKTLLRNARAVWNLYGPTETTIWSTAHRVAEDDDPVPIGKPLCNTEVYVLDDGGQPVPPGVPGELYIGGDGVTRGYLNRPELTRERFVPDTFSQRQDATLYRTGDRVRFRDDGCLEYLGRVDFQIKLRGYRIEPGEIENVLESHPAVERAVVIVREIDADARLVAYLTPAGKVDVAVLREHLKNRLPAYMLPQHYVELDAMPLTVSGKVDRKSLPEPFAMPRREHVAPRTATEQRIAAIWQEVLGAADAGVHDNFFDLGGHSLLAARCITRLRETCRRDIPMVAIFEQPVLADLAATVDALANHDHDEREVFEI